MWLLAATLMLTPAVAEETQLRVVAAGVGDERVTWRLEGAVVATTADREPATVTLPAGTHNLTAEADAHGWSALARPDPEGPGARYVDGWVAHASPAPDPAGPRPRPAATAYWPPVLAGGLLAAVLLLVPKQP